MKSILLVAMLFATGSLGGCVSSTCDWGKPIRPTMEELDVLTEETQRQIDIHNETGEAICNWKP